MDSPEETSDLPGPPPYTKLPSSDEATVDFSARNPQDDLPSYFEATGIRTLDSGGSNAVSSLTETREDLQQLSVATPNQKYGRVKRRREPVDQGYFRVVKKRRLAGILRVSPAHVPGSNDRPRAT